MGKRDASAWLGALCLSMTACHPREVTPPELEPSAVATPTPTTVAQRLATPEPKPAPPDGRKHKASSDDLDSLLGGSVAAGEGTTGLGNLGTIGQGSGAGYGRGAGILGGSSVYGLKGAALSEPPSSEAYAHHADLTFQDPAKTPLSTFSADVDTASYSNVRRMLLASQRPPVDAVRTEELVNYPRYHDAPPTNGDPLTAHMEIAACPWEETHRLLRIGVKAREIDLSQRPASNLVFLVDTSGSMNMPNKLPLLVRSLELLVEKLDARDRVSIVTYAGAAGVALPPTPGNDHQAIWAALERLESAGGTNGNAGIQTAYDLAASHKVNGINRVILATDGDFNVGVTKEGDLQKTIESEAKRGIALSVLGFGRGNYKDRLMESLADHGDGNYAYIDTLAEGRRVLVEQMTGTLITVAKDVKLQLELDPKTVSSYRQIGYEDRQLAAKDFADDRVDAGDVGAGHDVVALYELVPRVQSGSPAMVKIRWKRPGGTKSTLATFTAPELTVTPSADFTLSAGLAELGMLLRGSTAHASWDQAIALVMKGGRDDQRKEIATLIDLARRKVVSKR